MVKNWGSPHGNFDVWKIFCYSGLTGNDLAKEREYPVQNTVTIVTIGEILVEFVSHRANCALTQITGYSGPYPSGAPAIFLDQAARMGAVTQMIGGVGADGFGRCVLDRLRTDNVGVTGVTVDPQRSTGVAFVSYYDDGNRDFIFHLENTAADHFSTPHGLFDAASTWLHVSAASLGNARMRNVIMALVNDVFEAGGKITCDPNARPEMMRDGAARTALADVMDRSFCLMPSTSDLGFLFPNLTEEAAIERLLEARPEVIVIKRGAAGATVVGYGERHDFAGHNVDEVDPTGAGDCFCGTFVALMAQGASLKEAGTCANAAGAIAVTRRGPMEGNSAPEAIAAFLAAVAPEEIAL
jgi:sugar/nucleoside kinase (ribokinase family)